MCGFGLYNKILNAHEGHKESTGDGVREMRMRSLEIYGKLWELWLLFWNQWEVIGEFKQSDRILSIKKIILHAVLWTDYRNVRCKTEWTVITWHEIERLEVIRSDLNFRCIFKVKLSFFFFFLFGKIALRYERGVRDHSKVFGLSSWIDEVAIYYQKKFFFQDCVDIRSLSFRCL